MKVLTVFGTRPEAIKMAPVVKALEQCESITSKVCVTAQHREMLDQVLDLFDIDPDYDLDIMSPGQDLFDVTANVLHGMKRVYEKEKPDLVLVHGDTTTCFSAGLAAFYLGIDIGHVEAGLRTQNLKAPFPEEANRTLVGKLASIHFAPTESSERNLLNDLADQEQVYVTGNTVTDALRQVVDKLGEFEPGYWLECFDEEFIENVVHSSNKLVLITGHRRENFGQGFIDLCNAIRQLAEENRDVNFVYPVHLNPNVRAPVNELLSGLVNVILIEPLEYLPFVYLMGRCHFILTDSGGIQEEAPTLGKPVLVMRTVTERPEAVWAGTVSLVGTNTEAIVKHSNELLHDEEIYSRMSSAHNPYGDGFAAQRIVDIILRRWELLKL